MSPGSTTEHGPTTMWQQEIEAHILTDDALLHVFTHMCKVATESQAHCTELSSLGHEEFPHSRMQTAQSGKAPAAQQRKSKHKIHSESTQQRAHKCDPITSVVTTMLTEPLHFVLSETGASFFKQHTACTFPYHLMTLDQKHSIQRCLRNKDEWKMLNSHIVFKEHKHAQKGKPYRLDPTTCLKTLCRAILSSRTVENKANRIALCNIILQRTHTHLPVSNTAQRALIEFSRQLAEQ